MKLIRNKKEKRKNNKKPNQLTNKKAVTIEAFFLICSIYKQKKCLIDKNLVFNICNVQYTNRKIHVKGL